MLFAVVVLLCALALGVLCGGRLANLAHLRLHQGWLVVVALALQVTGALVGGPAYPLGLATSVGFLGWFLGKSMLETRGMAIALLSHFVLDAIIYIFLAIATR